MKVYIAEKPSLGKAIADQLAKASPRVESSREFIAGKNWVVCWAAGHIFEQEQPDYYIERRDPGAKKTQKGRYVWDFRHLPLVPAIDEWALRLTSDKSGLYSTIKRFVKQASVVVNAGDPDREGQLLIDEILKEIGNKAPVKRILVSAYDEHSVQTALANERDNSDFQGMCDAALARSRADWLAGMNFSRAATLQARASGYGEVVSIGRVQTPVLGLIVERHLEIESFKPVDYFTASARLQVRSGAFVARWKPRDGQPGLDSEGRLLDRRVAEQLNAAVKGKIGTVVKYSDEEKRESAPLPFSLDKLQVLASRKYGYKADAVLEAAQALYERHKLTSYPRSDCQHLPSAQIADARAVLSAVTANLEFERSALSQVDTSRRSAAFNDDKITAHHAIVPTAQRADIGSLSPIERDLYAEICRRYVAQFMPPRVYRAVSATVDVVGHHFVATGTTTISPGWRALEGSAAEAEVAKGDELTVLPPMAKGESADCLGLDIEAKQTKPPKHFTDASLIEAMINIHKFVTNEQARATFEKMRTKGGEEEGACGLGTPATRHTFVPRLIDVGLVTRVDGGSKGGRKSKESSLVPTAAGIALIKALPSELAKPDMTAMWEVCMRGIEAREGSLERFLDVQSKWIGSTIDRIRSAPLNLPSSAGGSRLQSGGSSKSSGSAGAGGRGGRGRARSLGVSDRECAECGRAMVRRKGARGEFFGCSGYPGCRHLEPIS